MELAFDDPSVLDRPVGEVMEKPLPIVGSGEPVEGAVKRLEQAPAAVVVDAGHPVGILTRSDLLDFLIAR
jgi:cystathionine beta-synthase